MMPLEAKYDIPMMCLSHVRVSFDPMNLISDASNVEYLLELTSWRSGMLFDKVTRYFPQSQCCVELSAISLSSI